jgi:hypothetical protein
MKYRGITGENFYFLELKRAVKYVIRYPEIENYKESFRSEDILDCKSESNFNKKYSTVNKRMQYLTFNLKENLNEVDVVTGKFINLYAILCSERIIAEFMDEVIKEKYKVFDYYIKDLDFKKFMELKADQSEIVDNWTEAGKKKMIVKIKNFILEGGFLVKEGDKLYKIVRPIVFTDIIDEIKENGNKKILAAMLY